MIYLRLKFDNLYKMLYCTNIMKTVTASYARNNFQELINAAAYQDQRFVITRHGKPMATIEPTNLPMTSARSKKASRAAPKKSAQKNPVSVEFKQWLKNVLTEDAEILDELSIR